MTVCLFGEKTLNGIQKVYLPFVASESYILENGTDIYDSVSVFNSLIQSKTFSLLLPCIVSVQTVVNGDASCSCVFQNSFEIEQSLNLCLSALLDMYQINVNACVEQSDFAFKLTLLYELKAIVKLAFLIDKGEVSVPLFVQEHVKMVCNKISDILGSIQIIYSLIKASSIESEVQINRTGFEFLKSQFALLSDIRGLVGKEKISSSIDSFSFSEQLLLNEIAEIGFENSFVGKNAIETSVIEFEQDVVVFTDNEKLKGVSELILRLFSETQVISDIDINCSTRNPEDMEKLLVKIQNSDFLFYPDEIEQQQGKRNIWARAKAKALYDNGVKVRIKQVNKKASEIAQQLLMNTGISLDWQIDDWLIPAIDFEGYPIEAIKRIAESVGATIRGTPDDTIHVVYPYEKKKPVMMIGSDRILKMKQKRIDKLCDGVKIIYGKMVENKAGLRFATGTGSPFNMKIDSSELQPGKWARLKVYSLNPYTLNSNADNYFFSKKAEELVEEEFSFDEPGIKMLSYPLVEVVDFKACEGVKMVGHYVMADGECKHVYVKYKTRYDLWLMTCYEEKTAIVCSASTSNCYMLLAKEGNRIETIEEPLISDVSLARKRAEVELLKRRTQKRLSLVVPFEPNLVVYEGCCISTPYGNGIVLSESIRVSSKPLQSLIELEVMLWQD